MSTITLKTGSSFSARMTRAFEGHPVDLTGYSIRSSIRDAVGRLHSLTVEGPDESGAVFITAAPALTEQLAPGDAEWDVRMEREGGVEFSPASHSIKVRVIRGVTP